jgi:preprotein translocase subunit SecD
MLAMISNPSLRKPEYYGVKSFGKISTSTIEAVAEESDQDSQNDNTKNNKSGAVL